MKQCRHLWIALSVLLLGAITMVACADMAGVKEVQRRLGLEQKFAHTDLPAPPSVGGFVRQMGLASTSQIRYRNTQTGQQHDIRDPQTISQVMTVLRTGKAVTFERANLPPGSIIHLEFVVDVPVHTVTAIYDVERDTLTLYNVPTRTWPNHMVATYPFPHDLGAALLATLALPALP